MNEKTNNIIKKYDVLNIKFSKSLKETKAAIDTLTQEVYSLIDHSGFTAYVESRKKFSDVLEEKENKIAKLETKKIELTLALNLSLEMQLKVVYNSLMKDITSSPEKWTKYPTHYKKFKEFASEFLGPDFGYSIRYFGTSGDFRIWKKSNTSNDLYCFYMDDSSQIEPEKIKADFEKKIIDPENIMKEVKKALATRQKLTAKIRSLEKEVSATKSVYSDSNLYYVLPALSIKETNL